MTTLSYIIAFGPLALYFVALAAANSGRRTRVVTGQQDFTAIALGLIGFVMIGPVMMFLPVDALSFWGITTWPMIAVLYALVVVFISSMFPPRLIVYNTSPEELRVVLETVASDLDQESRWCGNCLAMPGLGIQLYLEKLSFLRNVSLIATGTGQDIKGWQRVEKSLVTAFSKQVITPPNRIWMVMLLPGFLIGLIVMILLSAHSHSILSTIQEFLIE